MGNIIVRVVLAVNALGVAACLAGIVAVMLGGERMLRAEDD